MHRSSRRNKRAFMARMVGVALILSASFAWAEGSPNHVRDVKVHESSGGATEIEVLGTTAPVFNVKVADGGKRLIIDLSNADVAGAPEALTKSVGVVGGIQTQAFKTDAGNMTRLSVNLSKLSTYRVRADGTSLKIALSPSENGAPTAEPVKVDSPTTEAKSLTDVKFERIANAKSGPDRVVISMTGIPPYTMTTTQSGKVRLEMKKVQLPESLKRTLDVASFKGPLKSVSTFYDPVSQTTVIEIDRAGDQQGIVSVEGQKLVWAFDAARGSQSPIGGSRHTVTVAREESGPQPPKVQSSINGDSNEPMVLEVGGAQAGFTSVVPAQATNGKYKGQRMNLDLKDTPIHEMLRLFADVGRVNIVAAEDVGGSVTIVMRNVPWDQALDVVLQAKGLGMVRQGNLIRVAQMSQLQKERELKLAAAKQEYELTPLETRLIPVSYATADELQTRAKELLSPRGTIAVDQRTNVLIARDIAGNLNNIEELVRSLDTQTPQVLIEARIVEASSRYLRDVGIQWGGDATFSEATGNPTGIAFPSKVTTSGGNYDSNTPTAGLSPFQRQVPQPNFAVNLPAAVGTGQGGALGFSLGSIDNNFNLGVRLSAAEASGMLRIVSSPRILTLDNRQARISQGTLIPFSQISAQGVQTTFQEAKLQLLVKPHVTADGSVSMFVKINRDEPDFNQTSARGDPTILKREAETELLVMDGHTAVIGGIYTRNTGRNIDQVPFFGDIPILGVLFQRRRASDTRNELVIFLTPRIVNRAEALGH